MSEGKRQGGADRVQRVLKHKAEFQEQKRVDVIFIFQNFCKLYADDEDRVKIQSAIYKKDFNLLIEAVEETGNRAPVLKDEVEKAKNFLISSKANFPWEELRDVFNS